MEDNGWEDGYRYTPIRNGKYQVILKVGGEVEIISFFGGKWLVGEDYVNDVFRWRHPPIDIVLAD